MTGGNEWANQWIISLKTCDAYFKGLSDHCKGQPRNGKNGAVRLGQSVRCRSVVGAQSEGCRNRGQLREALDESEVRGGQVEGHPASDGPATNNTASDNPSSSDNSKKDGGSCPKSGGDKTDVPLSIFQAVFSLWFSEVLSVSVSQSWPCKAPESRPRGPSHQCSNENVATIMPQEPKPQGVELKEMGEVE